LLPGIKIGVEDEIEFTRPACEPDLAWPTIAEARRARPSFTEEKPVRWPVERWVAAAIIAGAALLGCIHLERASIWYDEAITLLTTSGHAGLDWPLGLQQFQATANLYKIVADLYYQDVHPPLYFCALAIWRIAFGPSLEVARAFSLLFIVASLWLLYRIARDTPMRWPWLPVAIYAVSAVGSWYAYDARPYAMATFLILLTQRLAQKRSRWTGSCAAVAFATHYFAVLCVGPLLAMECIRRWKWDRWWATVTACSFAFFSAPLLLLLRVHMGARPHQYPGFGWFPWELWALLKGSMQGVAPNTFLPGWKTVLLLVAVLALAGMRFAIRRDRFTLPILYTAFLLGFLVLAMVTNKSIAQMPTAYYLGLSAPWLALLVGYGVNALPRARYLLAPMAAVGLIAAQPIVTTINYRQMMRQMRAECSECSIVVGNGYAGAVPASVLYEAHGMHVFLLTPADSAPEVAERVAGQETVFFVPSHEPPAAKIEDEFLESYFTQRKNGFFEISLDRPPLLERAVQSEVAGPSIAGPRKNRSQWTDDLFLLGNSIEHGHAYVEMLVHQEMGRMRHPFRQ
jgi:uncharacterized membrane protein